MSINNIIEDLSKGKKIFISIGIFLFIVLIVLILLPQKQTVEKPITEEQKMEIIDALLKDTSEANSEQKGKTIRELSSEQNLSNEEKLEIINNLKN
ncbi:hypothetical protein A2442_01005 [Candidatus Campbellbacteria bacterium RIFOXYC2_FULL_35_25]|uniref:Uncharacterized protein n=1 Tax=Candidatus Campbellbacteria bacterium RIFOXYC2_FULL_35_25 TaxID=1797582 RepID=A0A1F5EIU6_9BACT|nr:MAG: hypothetical protein A2442_01005 [Candidatus Campbellbacteria bacterium RIFOXYC2_FULL_35_25]